MIRYNVVVIQAAEDIKLDVFMFPSEDIVFSARVQRLPAQRARVSVSRNENQHESEHDCKSTDQAMGLALSALLEANIKVDAVGHRVVHGGAHAQDSALIDAAVVRTIEDCIPLAPLHNPHNLDGIHQAQAKLRGVPHVAVFDTAFHHTLPPEAYLYAIPRKFHDEEGIRRYGFFGTSHRYVAERAAVFFGRPLSTLHLVTLHLDTFASACALDGGKSVDTSMGMTPLGGMPMATRSGDVDPAVILRLVRDFGVEEVARLLTQDSGLLGLSGKSGDVRELVRLEREGDKDAALALDIYCRRAKQLVGGYAAVLGGMDALVFTGSVGVNVARVREGVCHGLSALGALLDPRKNTSSITGERDLASLDSRVRILVIPSDDERAIAHETVRLAATVDPNAASLKLRSPES